MMFTDPIAQVVVTSKDGARRWDWVAPDWPFLTGVTMNFDMGGRNSLITFSIDAPYDAKEGLMDVNYSPFMFGNLVEARIGYASGGWTPWYAGYLADGGVGISVEPNGISGEVSVQATPAYPALYPIPDKVLKSAGFDGVLLLEGCCKEIGVNPVVSQTASRFLRSYLAIPGRSGEAQRKKVFKRMLGYDGMAIWDVIRSLCKENSCAYSFEPPTSSSFAYDLNVRAEEEVLLDPPINSYVMRGVIDESINQYPCFSFSPSETGVAWKAASPDPAAAGVNGVSIDKLSGEDVTYDAPPSQQGIQVEKAIVKDVPESSSKDGVVEDIKLREGVLGHWVSMAMPISGRSTFERMVNARQQQGNPAQTGSISTLGLPFEKTGNSCMLYGCGGIMDGKYVIEKLTHSYTAGSWDMTLECKRSGAGNAPNDNPQTAGGQV